MFRVHLSPPPTAALFPYTTLFRSHGCQCLGNEASVCSGRIRPFDIDVPTGEFVPAELGGLARQTAELSWYEFACRRSEEHTSELQSRFDLVCRLLLEKKKNK